MSRLLAPACLSLCLLVPAAIAQTPAPAQLPQPLSFAPSRQTPLPLTPSDRFRLFLSRTYSPDAVAKQTAAAGIQTLRNSPSEWGRGDDGFTRRMTTRFFRSTVGNSVEMGVGFLLKDDTRFYRSERHTFGGRLRDAAFSTFTARDAAGKTIPAYSRFAGIVAGNFAVNPMYPDSRNSWDDALMRSATSLGTRMGWNILREFLPDIKHKFHH